MKNTLFIVYLLLLPAITFAQATWEPVFRKADSLLKEQDFEGAEQLFEQALILSETSFGQNSLPYIQTRNKLGKSKVFRDCGKDFEPFLIETSLLIKNVLGSRHIEYAQASYVKGLFYYQKGDYQAAETAYQEAAQLQQELLGVDNLDYGNSTNRLAVLYLATSDYYKAEHCLQTTLAIKRKLLGLKHPDYAATLGNLAVLYRRIGNFTQAELLSKEVLNILEETVGTQCPDYAASLSNMASLYRINGDMKAAEATLLKILQIKKETLGDRHRSYATSLNNLAVFYNDTRNYEAAERLYKEALSLKGELNGKKTLPYVNTLKNLATVYVNMGRYQAAEAIYKEVLQIYQEIVNKENIGYIGALGKLGNLYEKTERYEEAEGFYLENITLVQKVVYKNFSFMSESEKSSYYDNTIKSHIDKFCNFAIRHERAISAAYDTQLFTKGILLSATQKMKSRILNSGDTNLIKKYQMWNQAKSNLARCYQMSKNELMQSHINIDSLEATINNIEKKLEQQSKDFTNLTEHHKTTWRDIEKKLKNNEAAIEIIRLELSKEDSVSYVALLIKKHSQSPLLINLKNGYVLEQEFQTYYHNMINFEQVDLISYNAFWKPIAPYLTGIKKVYLAPDGVYNQLSLNTLLNPETKKYLIEEVDIHLVSNTKDILAFGKAKKNTLQAYLVGYPIYDRQKELASEQKVTDSTRNYHKFQNLSQLPGTKREVESIAQLLSQKKYNTSVMMGMESTEENIKKIKSPKILHISTHGFFMNEQETNYKSIPMLRSGLLLTGVSEYTRSKIKPDTEDGILTALEAANLELDNTDLVVLSACQTGLGDVKAGEGGYGLQRAFRVAGAKSIIMSLWNVDDAVTQELMTHFYKRYAQYGCARRAFKEAQLEIKKYHPEPYFWGAFVMNGE